MVAVRKAVADASVLVGLEAGRIPPAVVAGYSWTVLIARLRETGRRPINDSWIAAAAIAHDVPVVTLDSDYDDAPGLTVIRV
ncbi:MAG: PIN domain-containing protein [Jiangellaceae bacterium]